MSTHSTLAPGFHTAKSQSLLGPCEAFFQRDCQDGASPSYLQDRYYREKLEIDPRNPADIRKAVEAYVQGLHWVLEYYYRGVVSWSWYYPYHYAPMASDLKDLGSIHVTFDRGQPFTPYQQLLAVLPAASHKLLPKPYQVCLHCVLPQLPCNPLKNEGSHTYSEDYLKLEFYALSCWSVCDASKCVLLFK